MKLWDSDQVIEEDKFRELWEGVLHHLNILQFLSSVHVFTTRGIENYRYSDWLTESASTSIEQGYEDVLPDLKYLTEEKLRPFVEEISAEVLAKAEVGFELVGDKDQVLAEAELAWNDKKLAILTDWQMPDREAFDSQEWEVLSVEEVVDNTSKVIEKLNQ